MVRYSIKSVPCKNDIGRTPNSRFELVRISYKFSYVPAKPINNAQICGAMVRFRLNGRTRRCYIS